MKKSILNLGKILDKKELKSINGAAYKCPTPATQSSCEAADGYWFGRCLYKNDYCY